MFPTSAGFARSLSSLILLVFLVASCDLFSPNNTDDSQVEGTVDGADDATIPPGTLSVDATGMAADLGVASYQLSTDSESTVGVSVALLGSTGDNFGTLTFTPGANGASIAEYTAHDGTTASVTTTVDLSDDDALLTIRQEFSAEGSSLTQTTELEVATTSVAAAWFEIPVSTAASLPSVGGHINTPSGYMAALLLVEDGADVVSAEVVERWAQEVGVESLLSSPAIVMLMAVSDDVGLIEGVEAVIEVYEPANETSAGDGSQEQALHLGAACQTLRDRIGELDSSCCTDCSLADPDRSSAVPTGITGRMSDYRYVAPCTCCMNLAKVKLADAMRCVEAWRNPADIFDDARCQAQESPPAWAEAKASEDGHSCSIVCIEDPCNSACAATPGVTGYCSGSRCLCEAEDKDSTCGELFPTTYCTGGRLMGGGVMLCPQSICGNGRHDTDCFMGQDEVCDSAGAEVMGCEAREWCDGCTACSDCDCESDGECGDGQYCFNSCVCTPDQRTCADSSFDFFDAIASGESWCDPGESSAEGANPFCTENQSCNSSCRCEEDDTPPATCPNGVVDSDLNEECDPEAPVGEWTCAEGEECADCRCLPSMVECEVNGVVDGTEECDPDADPSEWSCELGFDECVNCRCSPKCGNGVLDNSREDRGVGFETCEPSAGVACGNPEFEDCDESICGCRCRFSGDVERDRWGGACIPGVLEQVICEGGSEDPPCRQVVCPPNAVRLPCGGCDCPGSSTTTGCPDGEGGWVFSGYMVECSP